MTSSVQGVSATSSHLIFPITPRQVLLICYFTKEESHAQLNSSTDFQGSPSHLRAAKNSSPVGLHFHGYSEIYTRKAQSHTNNRKATDAKWQTDAQASHTVTQSYNKRPHQPDTDTRTHSRNTNLHSQRHTPTPGLPMAPLFPSRGSRSDTHPRSRHSSLTHRHTRLASHAAPTSHLGAQAPRTTAAKGRKPHAVAGQEPTQARAHRPRKHPRRRPRHRGCANPRAPWQERPRSGGRAAHALRETHPHSRQPPHLGLPGLRPRRRPPRQPSRDSAPAHSPPGPRDRALHPPSHTHHAGGRVAPPPNKATRRALTRLSGTVPPAPA